MNLSNMFPASGGLAAQIKKPVATAVAKPTDNKAVGSSLADCMQTRKRPGEWAIKWPKLRKQGFKDYRPLLTIQEVIDYCNRCEETGLGGFDYETSGDKDHRIPPTDEDGNTVTGKALDSWTRDVNLDPWKAEVCAMSLSAACDEARAIFIDNPGANQFEPGLSRSEARKRLFDTLEQYFFTNHKIVKIAVNMNFETKFTAKYGKYILMPCADPFIAWIRLSQLLLPNKIKNPKRPYVGKGLKPMTKEVFGVQMSEFTSVLERNQALFFDQVPNDEHDALSYCCEDSDYAVQHYLYWDEVAKQISNDNEVYPTYSDWLKNIEMPFTRVTGIMEYWGMKWDSDIAQVKREEAKNAIEVAAQTMKDLAASVGIKDLNVGVGGKTKDVKSFVFDTLKLPAAAWSDKTKDPSLDSNALMDMIFMLENKLEDPDEEKYLETPLPEEWEMVDPDLSYQDQRLLWPREYTTAEVKRIRIARSEEHPYKDIGVKFLKSMQTIQKYATLLSSHVEGREKYVNPVTGRIHAKYEPWTETARLASNSPNGQNVPRPDNDELGVRNFYKAAPGKVFLLEDESGFELRLTAWKSGCEVMESLHLDEAEAKTGNPIEHKAGRIPVVVCQNQLPAKYSERVKGYGKSDLAYGVVPLAVAYCHGLSDKANLMEYLQDQYLCLTGVDVDENEVLKMRKARALALKDKDSKASFIAQSQDDNAVENGLTRTKNDIMDTTNTPRLAELNGATATEIKMKYAGLDIKAGKKEPLLIQAFRSFFAIITDLLNVQKLYAAGTVSGVYETITTPELIEARDDLYQSEWLEVTISRNLPQNNKEIADIVAELADIVPDSYLYELLWFIDDPQKALEEMRAQKEESQQTSLTNSLAAIGYGADNLGDTGGDPDNPDDQQNSATGSTITQPPE